jgi:hypothetical protein
MFNSIICDPATTHPKVEKRGSERSVQQVDVAVGLFEPTVYHLH